MTMITRDNYEIYMIDYLDGNLSGEVKQQLMQFLQKNPDLKEELELIQDTPLPVSNETFEQKDILKKKLEDEPVSNENIDEWCIAAIEDDLPGNVRKIFNATLKNNPQYAAKYTQYLKTKLEAEHIPFPGFKPWNIPNFDDDVQPGDVEYWAVAELEKDLTNDQSKKWEAYKNQHQEAVKAVKAIEQTRLQSQRIVFPYKKALKKQKARTRYLYPLSALAAAAAVFYLFISIADIPNEPFKSYNRKMAKMEQQEKQQQQGKYPTPALFNPAMKNYMFNTIAHVANRQKTAQKETDRHHAETVKTTQIEREESLEAMGFRNVAFESPSITPATPELKTEVISADKLHKEMYAHNTQQNLNLRRENKLTLFRAAQKGVEVINNKVGTNMQLEARYNNRGEKEKVRFSTSFFSISRNVNK